MKKIVKSKIILTSLFFLISYNTECKAVDYKALNQNYLNNIKQAQYYESLGDIKKSNEFYQKADKIFSNRYESSFGLAKTYGWMKNTKLSEYYFHQLLKNSPEDNSVIEQYANLLKDKGIYPLSINLFEKLFLKTKQEKYRLNIAEIFYLQGNYDKALGVLNSLKSKTTASQKLMANSYFNKADYKNAKIYYKQYLSANNSGEELIKYAKSLFYSDNTIVAKEILEKYLQNNVVNKDIALTLGDIYLSLNEFDKASNILEKIIPNNPEDIELKTKYASSLMALNKFQKANIVLSELINVNIKNKEIINLYVDSCFALGEFSKASEFLTKTISLLPEDGNLKMKLAKSLEAQGKFKELSKYIPEIEALSNKNSENYNLLANYYTYKNDFDKALNYSQLSYKEKPTEETLFKIAEIYRFKNDVKNAEENYKNLIDSKDYGIKAHTKLAYLKLQQGKLNTAKDMFKEISLKTNEPEAVKGIAQVAYLKEDYFTSIKTLKSLDKTGETDVLLAKNYNKLLKGSTAEAILKNNTSDEAKALKAQIERNNAFKIEPVYSLGNRNGDVNQHLSSQIYGFAASKVILPDIKVFGKFEMTPYKSKMNKAKGMITSYTLGSSGKIGLKTDYLGEIALDNFSNNGQAALGQSVLDYKINDNFKLKTGFVRSLVDESMLSTTGLRPETGIFKDQLVGRIIDNKLIFDTSAKLPYDGYLYTGYHLGYKKGHNSSYNPYQEIMGGVGKLLYATDENKLINQVITGYNIYYTGYRHNRLNYGGASLLNDPLGSDRGNTENTGGYFSPESIIVNNISLKLKGAYKPLNLKYLNESYVGVQNLRYTGNDFTWGNKLSLIWNEEGRLGVKLGYNTNFYGVARQQNFFVQLLIKDFLRKQKCSESL